MTKKQKQYLTDYRKKIKTKRLNLVLPFELVDQIGKEMNRRESTSFTATIIELIKERLESIDND